MPPESKKTKPKHESSEQSKKDREQLAAAVESEILALKSDLTSLVNQFATLQSLNYDNFMQLWQTMRMPEMIVVATGQRPNRELRIIINEALTHAAEVFAESIDQQTKQYGALYLMYSLYFVQPTIPKIKIRLTLNVWRMVKQVLEDAVSNEQWDAVFIGGSLVEADAFYFVATMYPLIPEKPHPKQRAAMLPKTLSSLATGTVSGGDKLTPSVDALLTRLARDTDEFELAQSEYLQAKQSLGSLRLPGLDRSDAGIANDILSKIRRLADS